MSKDLSVKYYQSNKERLQKKKKKKRAKEKFFLNNKKMDNIAMKDTKTYLKMKNKSLLSIEQNIR